MVVGHPHTQGQGSEGVGEDEVFHVSQLCELCVCVRVCVVVHKSSDTDGLDTRSDFIS